MYIYYTCLFSGVMQFSKQELSDATRDFDVDLKVGEGGFGTVYKGSLRGTFFTYRCKDVIVHHAIMSSSVYNNIIVY